MNQSDKSDERPSLTSQSTAPPPCTSESPSNEKIPLPKIEETPSTSRQDPLTVKLPITSSIRNLNPPTVPISCQTNPAIGAQIPLKAAVPNNEELAKIVVSNQAPDQSSFKSELDAGPSSSTFQRSSLKRPLVAYEEEEQKGEPSLASASVPHPKPQASERTQVLREVKEEKLSRTEFPASDAAALVEEQQPSTSTSGASNFDSSLSQKPKTKRVRISIKLDHLSALRLKRLAAENPKLLRKLGLKAYRINNLNGSSNKFHLIKVPRPRPPTPQSQPSQRPGRRQSRATSSASVHTPIPGFSQSPTRFTRSPYLPPQRALGVPPPGFPMEQQRSQQSQQYPYPPQYPLQQIQRPQQQQQQPPQQRYSSPVPPQQIRPQQMGQPEPGPSNVSDSPLLVNLLSNNSQSSQPGTPQQLRYPPPTQQQMPPPPQQQMMPAPGYPQQQQMPPPMMQPQNPYAQYPPQRMPQHHMGPPGGPMQQMPGQPPHMIQQQSQIPPQGTIQNPPQESPTKAKAPRKRTTKKQKAEQAKAEEQRKMQMAQMAPPHIQQHPQEYYMMTQRMSMSGNPMQQRVAYPYPQYPQGQQPSTSMMPPNYPGQPYPQQQQQMWQQMPPDYQMMHPQMMRPPGPGNQTPGTPTSMHGYPNQSPSYPPNPQQKMRMQTPPNYPQPSPQYSGPPQQQAINRQFMSPPNHPSPSYAQGQQTPNQFAYPQPQPPQVQQQMMQQGQPQTQQNPPQSQEQGQQQGNIDEFAQFAEYGGSTFEGIVGLDDLGGEECDLDSITPMNTDPMPHGNPQQQQQSQQQTSQMIQQQQTQQQPQFEGHQFAHPHMQAHQQSPMGPPQGYHASPGYQQQFQRPQSPHFIQQMQHMSQQQQIIQQQQQQQPPQSQVTGQGPSGDDVYTDDGDGTKIDDSKILSNSPPKCPPQQQRKIEDSVESVLAKFRNNDQYIATAWERFNTMEELPPAPATKRKSKSTNSRPPSRQPKNSQSSSTANTPTPGPIIAGHSSTGTEPSTPIKEEVMDYKDYKPERKNSALSTLLSGNTTPTVKSEENGVLDPSCSVGIASPTVKSERDTTATPMSTVSTPVEMDPPPPPQNDPKAPENNNGNGSEQYSRFNGHTVHEPSPGTLSSGEAIALKTKQEVPSDEASATADSSDTALMPPPCKIRKTDEVLEDNSAKYFEGDHLSATS